MNSQEFRALQESYSQVYDLDESAIGDRARNAVADQRLDAAQGDTQQSVDKLGKREKVTRASAHIAAKKTETTARNMHPKPGTTGAYRITDSFDLYNIILSHLLDEGYADTNEAAITIMANMSEDWRESIVEKFELAADPSKPQSPKPTTLARKRKRHDDWKGPDGETLKGRMTRVVGTQRRQDTETGVTN